MAQMRQMTELEWVHTDFDHPHPIVDITLDPVATAQLGINRSTAQLQMTLQTGDMQVGSIWEGNYEVPVSDAEEARIRRELEEQKKKEEQEYLEMKKKLASKEERELMRFNEEMSIMLVKKYLEERKKYNE